MAAIQGALGGSLALGGAVTSVSGAMIGDEFVFGGSDSSVPQLIIQTTQTLLSKLVSDVVTLNLKAGIANSFDAKLSAVMAAIDDTKSQNDIAVLNGLYAFINAVEAQRGKQLSNAQADALINSAQQIITALSN